MELQAVELFCGGLVTEDYSDPRWMLFNQFNQTRTTHVLKRNMFSISSLHFDLKQVHVQNLSTVIMASSRHS